MRKNDFLKFLIKYKKECLSVLLIVFLVTAGAWIYGRQSLFQLSKVRILSSSPRVENDLLQKMLPFLGKELYNISLKDISNISLKNPFIENVQIRKKWPSELLITVFEKKPIACIKIKSKFWIVDEKGSFLEKNECKSFPKLSVSKKSPVIQSKILKWLSKLSRNNEPKILFFSSKIETLIWTEERGLVVHFFDIPVSFELGYKNFDRAWKAALKSYLWIEEKHISALSIDASYKGRALVKLAPKLHNLKK